MVKMAVLGMVSVLLLVACAGPESGTPRSGESSSAPPETATAPISAPIAAGAETSVPTWVPTSVAVGAPADGREKETATIELSAQDSVFDKETIKVAAGSRVALQFTNNDTDPHNFAAYETNSAEVEIFVGDVITGPGNTITYSFDAPAKPGAYFFRCDVHPYMKGELIVE